MKPRHFQIDFSLRADPTYSRWAGVLEELPYASRGQHRYVLHLPRLLGLVVVAGAAAFVLQILGLWFVQYRPLEADISPLQLAIMQWHEPSRLKAAAQLTAYAGRESAAQAVWRAHDLYLRALALDPSNQTARLGLARLLHHEGFRPQALNLLTAGLARPDLSAEYLLFTGELLLSAGEQATITRLLPAAYPKLPAGTTTAARHRLVQLIVQAYLDQNQTSQAIAFARDAGFENDDTLGATRLHVRELIDRGRYSEAAQVIGDVQAKGTPSPATSLLLLEATVGKGDTPAAMEVARSLAGAKLSLAEVISLLQQLHRIIVQEGKSSPEHADGRTAAPTPGSSVDLYHRLLETVLGVKPALPTVVRLAGMLADAPDSATLREFAPRMEDNPVHLRLWLSAQVDALMAEGQSRQALTLYLDRLGGILQQSDDAGASAQSALLYYLNYSTAPLVEELGRILAQRSATAGNYSRAARILLGNHRWEGAARIASLGQGLFPGNSELRFLEDQAAQGAAKQTSSETIAGYTGEKADQITLEETLNQGESHLAAHNDGAVLSLIQQVEKLHPRWQSEAAESLAWLRVRAILIGGNPFLAAAAAGDYVGTDAARARRLFDWATAHTGEAEKAGWLGLVARLFEQRFPNLPPLDRWALSRHGGNPAEMISEFDRLVSEGRLADASALLDAIGSAVGLDLNRRADVAQRRLTLAVARGQAEETTQLATELIRMDPRRVNQVVLVAERQALLSLELARAAQNFAPDSLRSSPLLLAMQATVSTPAAAPAPSPAEQLQQTTQTLLAGRYAEAEQAYRQYRRGHTVLPPDAQELGSVLESCFALPSLQPQQARQAATMIYLYQPSGPALVAALLAYHRTAQNEIPIQALQSALTTLHESN